jgi:hypothetical protein
MGWNNGANSNQLYRPEASRLLTGAPADINKCKELFNNLPAGVDSGRIPASDSMNGSDAEAAPATATGVNLGVSNPNWKHSWRNCKKFSTAHCLG